MVRVIVDPCGNGHQDLWLKIDLLPERSFVADSYFLQSENVNVAAKKLIENWIKEIDSNENQDLIILPFDYSDEYTAALKLEKVKSRFILSYVYSKENGNPKNIDWITDENYNWEITKDQILDGLNWSLAQL